MLATMTPQLEQETNPWTSAAIRFDEAAARLRLDDGMCKLLKSAAREITVHIPVQLDDGRIEVRPKGTIRLLGEWLRRSVVRLEDPRVLDEIIEPLQDVRRLRQDDDAERGGERPPPDPRPAQRDDGQCDHERADHPSPGTRARHPEKVPRDGDVLRSALQLQAPVVDDVALIRCARDLGRTFGTHPVRPVVVPADNRARADPVPLRRSGRIGVGRNVRVAGSGSVQIRRR